MPVSRRLPAGPLAAHLDPDHLRRIVINLVENAQRHAATTVRVTVDDGPDLLRIDVDDDGSGISDADRDRVFQRFTRLDLSTPPDGVGCRFRVAIPRHRHDGPDPGARQLTDSPRAVGEWDRSHAAG